MRCDITKYSKSSDISAFRLNIAVAWICHLNVSLNSGDTDFCVYAKENGWPWMLKSECSSHTNQFNCFSCCSVCWLISPKRAVNHLSHWLMPKLKISSYVFKCAKLDTSYIVYRAWLGLVIAVWTKVWFLATVEFWVVWPAPRLESSASQVSWWLVPQQFFRPWSSLLIYLIFRTQFALVWGADPRIECEPQKWL
jgi:hypothetical protein